MADIVTTVLKMHFVKTMLEYTISPTILQKNGGSVK